MAEIENPLTPEAVLGMVEHWLQTPPDGYLGQSYGQSIRDLLQKAMSTNDGDIIIQKMKRDIPILQRFPNSVNILMQKVDNRPDDAKKILIEVMGRFIDATKVAGL